MSAILSLLVSFSLTAISDELKPLIPQDPKGLGIPASVPRTVDTNGNVLYMDVRFTTWQYKQAALRLMLGEVNRVAREMQLPEDLPITETNLTEAMITPFAFNYIHKGIGEVSTKHYLYYVTKDYKFNELDVANYDRICLGLETNSLPIEQMDTKRAYELATQWLASASMDIRGLNRDCEPHAALSTYWNNLARLGQRPKKNLGV